MTAFVWPAMGASLALAVTFAGLAAALRSGWAARMLDQPNERSLHSRAVPRAGGLAILAGIAVGVLPLWAALDHRLRLALAGYAVLALVSWIDDLRTLPATPRLLAHLAVAAGWALGLGLPPAWTALAVLAIAWSANLYNFMDGADGLAGGMTVIGFGAMAIGLASVDVAGAAGLAGVAGAAALGFLRFNFSPARVFLGDSGSIPLGFLAGALGLHGWQLGAWSLAFPLIVFLPFWFDATLTVLLRTARGEKPWRAHREHVYQKAVLIGLGHRWVALRWYALMLACAALALATRRQAVTIQLYALAVAVCVAGLLALAVHRRHRRTRPG